LPKKTTETIITSNNNYVIAAKGNQKALYKKIKRTMSIQHNIHSTYHQIDLNRGRCELRHISVSNYIDGISKEWIGLQQLIKVERFTTQKNKEARQQIAYYISSLKENAYNYFEGIKSHWEIENSLHWVKDVTFKEDESKIRSKDAPQNISTIKNIAINIFRQNNYTNLAKAQRLVANDIYKLKKLIT
jgi:predicted transposase YbfD/YdcC